MTDGAPLDRPELTLAIAAVAGLLANIAARHAGIPALALLLVFGVLLGPDAANVVKPELLGHQLHVLIGFAVAVILFEGGLALDLRRLRRERRVIQQLITVGALVSLLGGMAAAWLVMGWTWQTSMLFGTLVMVTGPTVISPLMRRLRIKHNVATILEAEGVFIDAIGAIVATVALEVALEPSGIHAARGVLDIGTRLALGSMIGIIGGFLIAGSLRVRGLVPEGLESVLTLALVVALYQGANAVLPESGLAAVIIAGVVVGNAGVHAQRELKEFKEQLTTLLVGLLFILLAADVRLSEVRALGWHGAILVAALVLIVRPLSVLAGTYKTDLDPRRRVFIAWVGPRGIIAAAVASLFANQLQRAGVSGGEALRASVFLIIAVTVFWTSLTGGFVASRLGLRLPRDDGFLILGANSLARAVAKALVEAGQPAILLDRSPRAVREAESGGIQVIFGNGLEPRTLHRAAVETRAGVIGMTPNEEVNLLFTQHARQEARGLSLYVVLDDIATGVTAKMVEEQGAQVMFGSGESIERWSRRIEQGHTHRAIWQATKSFSLPGSKERHGGWIPLVALRKSGKPVPAASGLVLAKGDRLVTLLDASQAAEVRALLAKSGLEELEEEGSSG